MSVIRFSVDISAPAVAGMHQDILSEFLRHVANALNAAVPIIQSRTRTIVAEALRASDGWAAINNGELADVLCIEHGSSALNQIERAIIENIQIIRRPVSIGGQYITGGFSVNILDDSYKEVLSAGNTSYSTVNGKLIPWLEWLLFYDTGPVIRKGKLIRTNRGVIAARDNNDLYIPSAYAGVQNDNFLTRAIQPLEQEIGTMIEQEVERRS